MENHSRVQIRNIGIKIPKLSIVIPCYNEAGNIPTLINRLESIQYDETEVILVDNGSTDDTTTVIEKTLFEKESFIKSVSIKQNIGYGHGIMSGVKEATGDVIARRLNRHYSLHYTNCY